MPSCGSGAGGAAAAAAGRAAAAGGAGQGAWPAGSTGSAGCSRLHRLQQAPAGSRGLRSLAEEGDCSCLHQRPVPAQLVGVGEEQRRVHRLLQHLLWRVPAVQQRGRQRSGAPRAVRTSCGTCRQGGQPGSPAAGRQPAGQGRPPVRQADGRRAHRRAVVCPAPGLALCPVAGALRRPLGGVQLVVVRQLRQRVQLRVGAQRLQDQLRVGAVAPARLLIVGRAQRGCGGEGVWERRVGVCGGVAGSRCVRNRRAWRPAGGL